METNINSSGTSTVVGSNLIIISRDILDNILMQLKELNIILPDFQTDTIMAV